MNCLSMSEELFSFHSPRRKRVFLRICSVTKCVDFVECGADSTPVPWVLLLCKNNKYVMWEN